MSKELDYLDKILNYQPLTLVERTIIECIKEKIQRLESIDNANPSEALECLERIGAEKLARGELIRNDDKVEPYLNTIKQALLKAQKEHKALDLLMQELDCKDFAELRKYARCGYEKLNKQYLKWEDLEFKEEEQWLKVKMGDNLYRMDWLIDGLGANVVSLYKYITNDYLVYCVCIKDNSHNFFNDLHLERVEE